MSRTNDGGEAVPQSAESQTAEPREELSLEIIRQMIRHEDALRDQRLGWLFALDGFLFATLGLVWDKKDSTLLICALALLGVVIGLSAVGSMSVSDGAIDNLRSAAKCRGRVMGIQRDGCFDAEPSGVAKLYPWKAMPWALVAIWPVIVAIHGLLFKSW